MTIDELAKAFSDLQLVEKRDEPYEVYRGKPVEIVGKMRRYLGYYQGLTKQGDLVLAPYLKPESPLGKPYSQRERIILCPFPVFINREELVNVQSCDEKYLKSLIGKPVTEKAANRSKSKKKKQNK